MALKKSKRILEKDCNDDNMVCPKCKSKDFEIEGIATGVRESDYICNNCGYQWTE